MSRMGVDDPPRELKANTWQAAYSKFYETFGAGKPEQEFQRRLKNVRDHFDSHDNHNRRRGWRLTDKSPQPLSKLNQDVFDDLKRLDDDALWRRIRPYLSKKEAKRVTTRKAPFFSSEFGGTRPSRHVTMGEATVTHGRIVDGLKRYVEKTVKRAFPYNTQQIDLAVDVNGELQRIYEVKTAMDTQSTYTAVGQLCMHSAGAPGVEKWIVLPGPIANTELVECLNTLGISILWHRLQGKSYGFCPDMPA